MRENFLELVIYPVTGITRFNQQFCHMHAEPLYYLATILDPRYKNRYFALGTKLQATEMLQGLMVNIKDCVTAKNLGEPQGKKT